VLELSKLIILKIEGNHSMGVFLRIDIDIIAMTLLGSIILIAYSRLDMQDSLNKAYIKVSMVIVLQLFFEASTCVINRRPLPVLIPISYILHMCLFITAPILSFYGYILINNLVCRNKEVCIKHNKILRIPVVLNAIFTLLSYQYHFIFYIDKHNVYHRGDFFVLFSISTYLYIMLGLILIIRKRKMVVDNEFIPLLLFILFPIVGGILQTIFYGPLLMWSSTAFSLVLIYVLLQQRMVHLDELTGVWSRKSFNYYINCRIKEKRKEDIGIIYCDIDHFKSINDKFGHMEGDQAIKTTTKIIKSVIKKGDIVVRMGGDEFIIICENVLSEDIDQISNLLEEAFHNYNQNSGKGYKLECSYGAGVFHLSKYEEYEIDQFLHHIDSLMYENKRRKKIRD
jgi:diguanylate cyclase (GGDEF)-like protein